MLLIVPLGKKESTGIPILTIFVCVFCIIVHVFANTHADRLALAFHPDKLDVLKMFSSVFTHADYMHLIGNLFFFYCFARTVETQISFLGYVAAFVLFVLLTNIAYMFSAVEPIPTLGLSGVVWGFMGIFLFKYPSDDIECFVWFIWIFKTVEIPALLLIVAFFAFDVAAYRNSDAPTVNYVAHFAGFASGIIFKLAFWKIFTTELLTPPRRAAAATVRSGRR